MFALTVLMLSCKGTQTGGASQDAPEDAVDTAQQDTAVLDTM